MQLHLYPIKCDIAVFDSAHSSIFVKIAGFDKLVERMKEVLSSYNLAIVILNIAHRSNTFMGTS